MKRSEINTVIAKGLAFMTKHRFLLPPFAVWTPEDSRRKGAECAEIARCQLGWDITDFGRGQFPRMACSCSPSATGPSRS